MLSLIHALAKSLIYAILANEVLNFNSWQGPIKSTNHRRCYFRFPSHISDAVIMTRWFHHAINKRLALGVAVRSGRGEVAKDSDKFVQT